MAFAGPAPGDPLKDPPGRASYSLGHQMGMDLVRQQREVDVEALRRGLRDGLAGREPELADAEREALLVGLKRSIVAAERDDRIRGASSHRQAGKAFLSENAQKPDIVVLPSGLQYRVVREGGGRRPGPNDRVTVRYRSTRLDGVSFHDSMRDGTDPETFRVSGLIPGLTEALQIMHEGSRWEIFVPPDLSFGRRGPLADQTLVYDLALITVRPPEPTESENAP